MYRPVLPVITALALAALVNGQEQEPAGSRGSQAVLTTLIGMERCQAEVQMRLWDRGLTNIEFVRMDARQVNGRRVYGIVRGNRTFTSEVYQFSCGVHTDDLGGRTIGLVDLIRR